MTVNSREVNKSPGIWASKSSTERQQLKRKNIPIVEKISGNTVKSLYKKLFNSIETFYSHYVLQ